MIRSEKVRFIKLTPNAKVPTYGTQYAAGADLYSASGEEIVIEPGKTVMVGTGIACEIPEGLVGLIFARSGLACKKDLAPANKVGVIDSDYRGEIKVALHNHGSESRTIEAGERIAQLMLTPYIKAEFEETDFLDETERGEGGFGSSGRF